MAVSDAAKLGSLMYSTAISARSLCLLTLPLWLSLVGCAEGESAAAAAQESERPYAQVTVGEDEYRYELRCARDVEDDGALIVSGRVGYGGQREVLGGFGYAARADKLTVEEAGQSWMANAGDGDHDLGDIVEVTLDTAGGSVFGEARFENFDGETVAGTFEFRCP